MGQLRSIFQLSIVLKKMSSTVLRKTHLNVLKIIIFAENISDSFSFVIKKQRNLQVPKLFCFLIKRI